MAKKILTISELAEEIIRRFYVCFVGDTSTNPAMELNDSTIREFLSYLETRQRVSATPKEICDALHYLMRDGRIEFIGFEPCESEGPKRRTKSQTFFRPEFKISLKPTKL